MLGLLFITCVSAIVNLHLSNSVVSCWGACLRTNCALSQQTGLEC